MDALRRRRRRHWTADYRGGLLLVALCALLHLPGIFSLPPIDRDEARFAEATRQMVAADTWDALLIPRFDGKPRLNKPPLIYWLQAVLVRMAGGDALLQDDTAAGLPSRGIWAYRLTSVLGALAAVLLTWRLGCAMFAAPAGFLAPLLLAASGVVLLDVRQARTDQVLLAWTVLAQTALWHLWRGRTENQAPPRGTWLTLWLAVVAGTLTKGPIAPLVVGLTALSLAALGGGRAWLRYLRPISGLGLVLLLTLPWLGAVAAELGWQRIAWTVLAETVLRGVTAREGHGGFPGYYLVLLPLIFWPGSLALVPALVHGWRRGLRCTPSRRWRRAGRDAEAFCLAWLLPSWLFFELAMTKLPHYVLPVLPALALLAGRALVAPRVWQACLRLWTVRAGLYAWAGLSAVLGLGLIPVLAWLGRWQASQDTRSGLAVLWIAAAVLVVGVVRAVTQRRMVQAQLATVGLAAVLAVGSLGIVLPHLQRIWLSSRVVAALAEVDPTGTRPFAAVGYQEDSLTFLTAGRVARQSAAELGAWWAGHPAGLVLMDATAVHDGAAVREVARLHGFNYSNGRWQALVLVERQP